MEKYLFAICFLSQLNLYGAELGRVSISGQGCDEPKKKVSILKESNEPQKVEMPLHFKLDKINASRFERKVCNISLPIKLNKNEKIQISEFSQNMKLTHTSNTTVKAELAYYLVGVKKPKSFELSLESNNQKSEIETLWKQGSVILESACGKDVILRTQVSAFAQGEGQASADSGEILFSIQTISCK